MIFKKWFKCNDWIDVSDRLPVTDYTDYRDRIFWVKSKKSNGDIKVYACHYIGGWTNLITFWNFEDEIIEWKEAKIPKI